MGYTMTPDSKVIGLFKRATAKGDKWVVSARVKGGNPTKITLGLCENLSARKARNLAKKHLADMAVGINPNAAQKMDNFRGITLGEAIEQYLAEKSHVLKPATIKSYRSTLKNNFSKWMRRPISQITPQECVTRYNKIRAEVAKRSNQKRKTNEPGEAEAIKAMRSLSAVLGYFSTDMLPDNSRLLMPFGNPVGVLAKKKLLKKLKSRDRSLSFEERTRLLEFLMLPSHRFNEDMSRKVETIHTSVKGDHADWLILLMCTALRRDEPLKITWDQVDFEKRVFTVIDTKNGNPLTLPMTERTGWIFERRFKEFEGRSEYVFPQFGNFSKPSTMNRVPERISKLAGVSFTPHDLRRTAATILNELGHSIVAIGKILNHSEKGQTGEYIQVSIESMRVALEELEAILFSDEIDRYEGDASDAEAVDF